MPSRSPVEDPLHVVKQEIRNTSRNAPAYQELKERKATLVRMKVCSVTRVLTNSPINHRKRRFRSSKETLTVFGRIFAVARGAVSHGLLL